jgi:hypothetical protein
MRQVIRIGFLAVVLATLSCSTLTPKAYQLEQIHQTYTAEWARAKLPDPGAAAPSPANQAQAFNATLAAIRNYKAIYGNTDAVAAHLTVLEGMIYLQSGHTGMARLMEQDIAEQSATFGSASGVATRDKLFAASYPALVDGWEAIFRKSVNPKDFTDAADALVETLNQVNPGERASAEVDSGGAYIATSAAIFYLWSSSRDPVVHPKKQAATKGAAALKPWMSELEITAVEGSSEPFSKRGLDFGSRQRFVDWYAWLYANAQ